MKKILGILFLLVGILFVGLPIVGVFGFACADSNTVTASADDIYDPPIFDVPFDVEEQCWYITFPFNYVGLYYDYFTVSGPVVFKLYSDFRFEFLQYNNEELIPLASFSLDSTFAGDLPFYILNQSNNTVTLNNECYLSLTSTDGFPNSLPASVYFYSDSSNPSLIRFTVRTLTNQNYYITVRSRASYHIFSPSVAPWLTYDLNPYEESSMDYYWQGYEDGLNGVTISDYLNNSIDGFMDITLFGTDVSFGSILSIGFGLILMGIAIKVFLGG